ncbi:amidase [Prauserella sp. ASG 168]|uniref:Amidase n=1 Tax=Prauserella cavernicola TaxID=2800127 RepID=A0A934QZ88_9PSEU|nr:amidase [Prauserella cavernicola]
MTGTELVDLSAAQLRAGYAERRFSPVEVLDAVLRRVEQHEPDLNAFSHRETDTARRQAIASARRWAAGEPLGELDGVPLTLKENIATVGAPLTSGTAAYEDAPPQTVAGPTALTTDAANAVRLGKTVMPDYGMLSSGVSSLHGISRSPWNPGWTVGGSSGGAAAAAAARFGPIHVGSDIGGSIRLPAGWLGLASLKPTFGIVPVDPPYLGRVVGPLARTVDDVATAMQVLARPDPLDRDHTRVPLGADAWHLVAGSPLTEKTVAGLRVAVHTDAGAGIPTDPAVAAIVREVARTFERAGADVEELPPFVTPDLLRQLDLFLRIRSSSDLRALSAERRARVLPYIREWALGGADRSGAEAFAAFSAVQELRAVTAAATRAFDVVLSPIAAVAAFPAHHHSPTNDPITALDHIAFTAPYNFADMPAATVNAGFLEDGRPVGVQLAGRRFADVELLRVARWYEQARPPAAVPEWPL